MIGTTSLVFELVSLVFFLGFAALATYTAAQKRQKRHYLAAAFALVLALVMGFRYVHQVRNHVTLGSLGASEISTIEIGERTLTQRAQLQPVALALQERRWFSPDHGGWGDTIPLVITLEDGRTLRFRVAYYRRQEGAVIEFFRGSERSYWADGYAFCPLLPSALEEVGVRLPEQLEP